MAHRWRTPALALLALAALQLGACGGDEQAADEAPAAPETAGIPEPAAPAAEAGAPRAEPAATEPAARQAPHRHAYFGDLHIHTRFSFDAFLFGVRTNPDDAYAYAKGAPLMHAGGYPIRLRNGPLDFLGVTDHAFYMGVFHAMDDPNHPLSRSEAAQGMFSNDVAEIARNFAGVTRSFARGERDPRFDHPEVMRDTWQEEIAAAQRHYRPGEFTTFIGYEYTSNPNYNLHRNVIFRGTNVPTLPFGALESQNPEDLWRWLDEQRAQGNEGLAIPHNSNWSAGHMFERQQVSGDPFDAEYAELRMRNEPIVEMTQVKGTSETHPLLSPNDEWADFEIWNVVGDIDGESGDIGTQTESTDLQHIRGGYVRDAYLAGLQFEAEQGFNPYKFGLIGSSDSHNAGASYEESSYFSKVGLTDATPELRGSVPPAGARTWPEVPTQGSGLGASTAKWGASGLAAVWADANTREAIYDAFRRKETFATSGPRIRVRFFAGFDYPDGLLDDRRAVDRAYLGGVPMGGDLVGRDGAPPRFAAWAVRDPRSNWLQRLQVVKGWLQDGEARERVYDVACSDGGTPNPDTHRCPDNGARVNTYDCSTPIDKGAAELRALWRDPDFDPGQRAFYYVRVLENPSCRWSTWDAVRAGVVPNPSLKTTVQERAWSSPIWYVPR